MEADHKEHHKTRMHKTQVIMACNPSARDTNNNIVLTVINTVTISTSKEINRFIAITMQIKDIYNTLYHQA